MIVEARRKLKKMNLQIKLNTAKRTLAFPGAYARIPNWREKLIDEINSLENELRSFEQ